MKLHYKLYLILIIFSMLISGCAGGERLPSRSYEDPSVQEITQTEATHFVFTEIPAESPTEASTEPDMSLDTEPGSFLLRYDDEITGDYLDYYLFIPKNPEINMPLIVFLHGDGEVNRPETLENYGMMEQARNLYGDNFPFIAIFPCTRVTSWVSGTIPETLKSLIDHVADEYSIDKDSIVITGHSRGAMGLWHMVSLYGGYFSAAVPVSCGPDTMLNMENCIQVPILAVAGTDGQYEYNYARAMKKAVEQINESGGNAALIILENSDHSDTCTAAYTEETFQWMLSQNKE